jgi:hypothetical protein
MTRHVAATDAIPPTVARAVNGMASWMAKQPATDTANSSEKIHSWRPTVASGNQRGRRCTISAPTVMPNSATEIATNAKWYHIVTLKMRVSPISSISVDNVTRNKPM